MISDFIGEWINFLNMQKKSSGFLSGSTRGIIYEEKY